MSRTIPRTVFACVATLMPALASAQEPAWAVDALAPSTTLPADAARERALATGIGAGTVGEPVTAAAVKAFFDAAWARQSRDLALAGEVVSVVHRGEILFEAGYGWADIENRVPADPVMSLFRIGSVTKPFVWTAIMQLAEQGRIDLNEDVQQYIDFEIPDTFDEPVRVWHLLTHTAGFEETWLGWGARGPDDIDDLGAELARLLPARVRRPGRHAAYSNYGAALAGYVVQRVSRQPWARYTEQHILEPLGMHSTNARLVMDPSLVGRHAKGYAYRDGRLEPTSFDYLRLAPAGHVSSTAHDMATFMLAHLGLGRVGDRRILEERTAARMHSPLFAPYPELPPILHGFYRSDRNGRVVFGHGGDVNQFHSAMLLLPDQELGIFVSFNSDPGSTARARLTHAFIDHFFPAVRGDAGDGSRGGAVSAGVADTGAAGAAGIRAGDAGAAGAEGMGAGDTGTDRPAGSCAGDPDTGGPAGSDSGSPRADGCAAAPYAGHYLPLRSAFTTFERLRALGGGLAIEARGGDIVLTNGTRLRPTGRDRFTTADGALTMVFERDPSGRISHVLAGSPLASFRRAHGIERPEIAALVVQLLLWTCVAAVLGWGYRLVRPAPEAVRLPSPHVRVALVHALLLGAALILLPSVLGRIAFGLPPTSRAILAIYNLDLGLGLLVVGYAARQWTVGAGSFGVRLRYAVVALTGLVSLWFAWTFRLIGAML